jgi:hypothetical protein
MTFTQYLAAGIFSPVIWSIVKPMAFQILASSKDADLSLLYELSSLNRTLHKYFEDSKPNHTSELELMSAFEFIRYIFYCETSSHQQRQHHFFDFSNSLASFECVLKRYIKNCATKANFLNEVDTLMGDEAESAEFREYFKSFYQGPKGARSGKPRRLFSLPFW